MGDPGQPGYPAAPPKGLALSAMVLGIIGLILAICLFFFPFVAVVVGLIAVVLGIVALRQVKSGRAAGRGMALTGLVTGAIALVLGLALTTGLALLANSDLGRCMEKAQTQSDMQTCFENATK